MAPGSGIDQLHVHSHLVVGSANASFENVADTEFPRDLPHVNRFSLVGKSSGTSDYLSCFRLCIYP
jgi:hypothetical protein